MLDQKTWMKGNSSIYLCKKFPHLIEPILCVSPTKQCGHPLIFILLVRMPAENLQIAALSGTKPPR